MKTISTLIFSLLMLSTCKTGKMSLEKQLEKPMENIAWLKEHQKTMTNQKFPTKAMVVQYTYNGEPVFLVDDCYQCPDAMTTVYNAKKEVLCTFGGMVPSMNNTCPDFDKKATDKKVLWKNFE